jgi:hypothetical protein
MKAPNVTEGEWEWNEHFNWLLYNNPAHHYSETILTTMPDFEPSPADAKMLAASKKLAEALNEGVRIEQSGLIGLEYKQAITAWRKQAYAALIAAGYTEEP